MKAGWGIALAGWHRDLQGSWGPAQLHRSPPKELNAIPTLQKGPINQRHRVLVRGLPGCSFISSVCTSRKNMNLLTRVHRMTTNMDSIFLFFYFLKMSLTLWGLRSAFMSLVVQRWPESLLSCFGMERFWLLFWGFVQFSIYLYIFFNSADSNIWKLKLGHLSLESRLGFPAGKVTEVWINSLGGCEPALLHVLVIF